VKALVYLGPHRMELQDVPTPEPLIGEARVAVAASAICGSDLHGFREASPRRIPPLIMGHEAAGRVDAVGADVDSELVGRRVIVKPVVSCGSCARCVEGSPNVCPRRRLMGMDFPGAFAEFLTIAADRLLTVPDELPDQAASLVEPFANALHLVRRSVRRDDSVLVVGAGPIGLFAVRASALAGAGRTLVADRLPDRLDAGTAQGGEALDPGDPESGVAAATGGEGVDVVIDAVGVPQTWSLALSAVRFGGRIEAVGLGAVEGPLAYHTVISKAVTITGSYACLDEDFDDAVRFLANGQASVDGWIMPRPLAEGEAAFEALVGDRPPLKVVLLP
jgi:2-desacetyl-2-hydroxyethyl bacteriochlorophyllide A dehydrogenase